MKGVRGLIFLFALVSYTLAQNVGVDINGVELIGTNTTSALACAQQCDGNARCVAWSWDSCGKSACSLKATITSGSSTNSWLTINSCRTSDVRLGTVGVDHSGYDLPNSPAWGISAPSACAYQCRATAGCVTWSFVPSMSACFMKRWVGPSVAASGVISGVIGTNSWDYATEDLSSTVLPNNATTDQCANLCESNPNCMAWVMSTPSSPSCVSSGTSLNTCWLKRFVSGQPLINQACRTSGLASSFYNTAKSAAASFAVKSVSILGNQSDTHGTNRPVRDGGSVGSVGGKIVWFWSDTTWVNSAGSMAGFYDNSAAIGTYGNPLIMTGAQREGIPYTPEELNFNNVNNYSPRTVLWPKAGVVETSPGVGYLMCPRGYWLDSQATTMPKQNGATLSKVTIGADGQPSVTRLSNITMFSPPEVVFGSFAAVADQDYAYLYSTESYATFSASMHVARVPLASITDKSQYQYWNNGAQVWEAKVPLFNESSKAIMTTAFGYDGNVYYSSVHRRWIFVYNLHADLSIRVRSAVAPQGPFSAEITLFTYPPPADANKYIYGTIGTNLYDLTGRTMSTDTTCAVPGTYNNNVLQVQWA